MHYTSEFILANLCPVTGVLDIELEADDTSWLPGAKGSRLHGPSGVKYVRNESGEIVAWQSRN